MDAMTATMLAPLESPLTPPTDDVFTPAQWRTMMSLLDAVIPAITTSESDQASALCVSSATYDEAKRSIQHSLPSETDPSVVSSYLSESLSSIPRAQTTVQHMFLRSIPPSNTKAFRFILSILNSSVGCLLLTGWTTPFHLHSVAARQKILVGWSRSYLGTLRGLYRAVSSLAKQIWLFTSPTFPEVVGFPAVPRHGSRGTDDEYDFLDFTSPDASLTVETDVLIVGSGCGAGVCAKNLAQAGFRVLVAEKGYRFPSSHYPMEAHSAGYHLMENGGSLLADDGSTAVFAGSTFGGGGTVNWSASLQTQHFVRQEWADQGLPWFSSGDFQKCLDKVCGSIGATTSGIKHNFANRALLEGSRRLGYHAKEVPQNTGGKEHYCGYCTFGCASGVKHGPAAAFFPSAAAAGARFIQGFDVREIEFDQVNGVKKAVGAKGLWTDRTSGTKREIRVTASKVIVSAGTLNSPLLLMRSGIKNRHVGKNLHLHPATFIGARFEAVTNPWEGGILTSVNTSLENLDGHGHGCKIECTTMMPTYFLPAMGWLSAEADTTPGLDYKKRVSAFNHHVGFVVIVRDRDTGSVYADPDDGRVRVVYTPSTFDSHHMVEGSIAAAKIAYVNGAQEIFSMNELVPSFIRTAKGDEEERRNEEDDNDINEPSFQAWLQQLRRICLSTADKQLIGSAHQMGTCRMSNSAQTGVVDSKGRVWGFGARQEAPGRQSGSGNADADGDGDTGSLYVADASVFPSASGVNPMVTTLAIAEWVSGCIVKDGRGDE